MAGTIAWRLKADLPLLSLPQTMKHQSLIQETVSQLSSRFQPKVADVKKAIDQLIDKDYIERVEGTRDQYSYL